MTTTLSRTMLALVLAVAPLGCDASPDIDPIVRQLKGSWNQLGSVTPLSGITFSEAHTYTARTFAVSMLSVGNFKIQHLPGGDFHLIFTPTYGEHIGPFTAAFTASGYLSLRADTAGAPVQYFFKRTY